MDDEIISNFVAITSCDPTKAAQYLRLTDNNLEQAIQLFFDSPNLDLGGSSAPQPPAANPAASHEPIQIDSDDDMDFGDDLAANTPPALQPNTEDDEAMARRLQEEMYGSGGAGGAGGGLDQDEVRAPIDRRTETLVGPGADWGSDSDDVDAMVRDQMARRRGQGTRPGIFNQRTAQTSVWENSGDSSERRRELATATGGASEQSNKMNMLAELFRPPFEIMFQQSWERARDQGKEHEKWILVNIQDPAIFDCQRLNRDIWKNDDIKATVRENFIFMQYAKDDPRGEEYMNYYFHARDSTDAYPHIAIVDPRTGEQMKVWSGPPIPEPVEFHAQLHEYLDRYSLSATAKNPIAMRKSDKKKVDPGAMTEDEQMAMALQNSLDNNQGPKDEDPDSLTKNHGSGKGKGKAQEETIEPSSNGNSPFDLISSDNPHTEPNADPATTTRIQFRGGPGRPIVRRFNLSDPVRRIYEWIKAGHPWEGKEGITFDLSLLGKNMIESLDSTIAEAGLKNSSVNIEFVEE
ncbi:hypothetical protein P280DRAFT_465309 [Massarina eburnea CBS 473.64]|uniref:UBX domain-containing protein n=1 Tax=Massarina eburnea CBS 473.64 TaxID=1395130 RepID=A0A6A6SD55_9PLEO|nr:hypothetical protein P280DRAFT_465309 [Massarina eburnea CBS 473.64]